MGENMVLTNTVKENGFLKFLKFYNLSHATLSKVLHYIIVFGFGFSE